MAGQGRSDAGGPMPTAPGEARCISGEVRAVMSITPELAFRVTRGKLCRMIMEPTKLHLPSLPQCLKYAALPGGVSRAAKRADCKSAGLAFAGSSPASPTNHSPEARFYRSAPGTVANAHGLFPMRV